MRLNSEKARCIRDIAFSLFVNEGYEATSIRKICWSTKIDPPTLYYFFDSKKGLFFSIAHHIFQNYKELSQEVKESCKNMSPQERLFYLFKSYTRPSGINNDYARFFFRFSLFPPQEVSREISELMSQLESFQFQLTEDIIIECIDMGLIRVELESANGLFWRFNRSNILDIVFSGWKPDDEELKEVWDMFFQHRLKSKKH